MERGTAYRTCAVLIAFACLPAFAGPELPSGFRLEPVVSGLTDPSALAGTPDGRILIAERTTGNLRQIQHGQLEAAPLCGVSVDASGEGGLLGVTAHPDFNRNHWIYLYYTSLSSGNNTVERYTIDGSSCTDATTILADLGAGGSLLRNGGGLKFGPDGKLYVATGDVESSSNGQNAATLMGKVLRVNDDGSVPADNPTPGSLVYAVGLRDGRALSMSPAGMVYVSDAGEDFPANDHDEIHAVASGGNLGWDAETGPGGVNDEPLVSWLPTVGVQGIAAYPGELFPDAAADGLDNDHDAYGPDHHPGISRVDDNGVGTCVGSEANGDPCTVTTDCVPLIPGEPTHICELRDDPAEYCPGGTAAGDDACGSSGTAGIDELDESYLNNVFTTAGNKIQRAIVAGPGLDQLSSWNTFLDSDLGVGCPTGWTGMMAGRDGWLYALATNGGGAGGGLYRITHAGEVGPREVSGAGSYFQLQMDKTDHPTRFDVYFEDLRDDGKQPAASALPVRSYTVWTGAIGTWDSHQEVALQTDIEGVAVNDALRKIPNVVASGSAVYFLVSARSANLEGTTGFTTAGVERDGPANTDVCDSIGMHTSPMWNLYTCGRDFELLDGYGNLQGLYEHYRGNPILLDFSAVWCPPCHTEANVIELLYQDYKDRGVEILTVLMDEDNQTVDYPGRPTPAECRNWEDRPGGFPDHTFGCWIDPNPNPQESWPLYNAHGALPTNVLLDHGLQVIYTGGGYNESLIRFRLDNITTDACLH